MHDHGADYTILWRFHVVGMHLPHPLCSPWPSYCLVGSLPLLFVGITPLGKALCSIFAVTFSWGKIPLQRGGCLPRERRRFDFGCCRMWVCNLCQQCLDYGSLSFLTDLPSRCGHNPFDKAVRLNPTQISVPWEREHTSREEFTSRSATPLPRLM